MRKVVINALLLCGLATCVLAAQQASRIDRPAEPNMVFDDDGGKVQIVPADLAPGAAKNFHGGLVLSAAQQVSIFLGAGWADQQARSRQPALLDVASGNQTPEIAETKNRNIRLTGSNFRFEDFASLDAPVNDLAIQRKLSDLLQAKALPAPSGGKVYVVFLAPQVDSTLGGNQAGTDYAAYHNFVNLEAGEIHYVVVPFHQDARVHGQAAARAFAEAALNPNGQGWF